jgi:thioredoxin 1
MSQVSSVSDASFDTEVLQSSLPVLVDFWAEWCGPCRMIAPIVDEIATQYEGKVKVLKLNVDESSAIPAKYGVRGIPTLMLFKGGKMAASKSGYLTKSQLSEFLDSHP